MGDFDDYEISEDVPSVQPQSRLSESGLRRQQQPIQANRKSWEPLPSEGFQIAQHDFQTTATSSIPVECVSARDDSEDRSELQGGHGRHQPAMTREVSEITDTNARTMMSDDSATPLQIFRSAAELNRHARELRGQGEDIVSKAVLDEIIQAVTQERPMPAQELQQFLADRVPAKRIAEVMYIAFRFAFLEGEKRRLVAQ